MLNLYINKWKVTIIFIKCIYACIHSIERQFFYWFTIFVLNGEITNFTLEKYRTNKNNPDILIKNKNSISLLLIDYFPFIFQSTSHIYRPVQQGSNKILFFSFIYTIYYQHFYTDRKRENNAIHMFPFIFGRRGRIRYSLRAYNTFSVYGACVYFIRKPKGSCARIRR